METAIRWSPGSTVSEQRFLIADVNGHAFSHCRIQKTDGKELSYDTFSTHRKVPAFRAFDWSPYDQELVAVGQWSGEATVIQLKDEKAPAISLPIKHQRLCNAVTFGRPNLLATGLDRVRNDFCLSIWDLTQRLLSGTPTLGNTGKPTPDPLRKFASSEAVTSIKFFPGQLDTFVAGVKGSCIRIYDLRDNVGNASLQFQTAAVNNISIDPLDENYFAAAGAQKDATIQIWDRRSRSSFSASNPATGQSVNQAPILEYKRIFDSTSNSGQPHIWSLRYCKGWRGCLGALGSTGDFKVFETRKEHRPEVHEMMRPEISRLGSHGLAAEQLITKRVHHVERAYDHPKYRRVDNARIVSFDFTNLAGMRGRPTAILLRGNQSIETYELNGAPSAFSISPLAELVASRTSGTRTSESGSTDPKDNLSAENIVHIQPSKGRSLVQLSEGVHNDLSFASAMVGIRSLDIENGTRGQSDDKRAVENVSSHRSHEESKSPNKATTIDIRDALASFTLCRRRCTEGYLFDCSKNMAIVASDCWLRDLWDWIGSK